MNEKELPRNIEFSITFACATNLYIYTLFLGISLLRFCVFLSNLTLLYLFIHYTRILNIVIMYSLSKQKYM